jgi:hypothetical protein
MRTCTGTSGLVPVLLCSYFTVSTSLHLCACGVCVYVCRVVRACLFAYAVLRVRLTDC